MRVVIKEAGKWWRFSNCQKIILAVDLVEVRQRLGEVEALVGSKGWYAAGFIGYEAAPAFDTAFVVHAAKEKKVPLLWFGLFAERSFMDEIEPDKKKAYQLGKWRSGVSEASYLTGIEKIKEEIAAGNSYQVNFTYQLETDFIGDAWNLFVDLARAQEAEHMAFIETDEFAICSASPELFFSYRNGTVQTQPMKGTIGRGMSWQEDESNKSWLQQSVKDQAENVMIVDMMRHDLGKIATIGSVAVRDLFHIERYPTVWQMSSVVQAQVNKSIVEIMEALFPCASITGAPKAATMGIIRRLEVGERGLYTGCIGSMKKVGEQVEAEFNVAIRTVVIEKKSGVASYGVGGGIVWDSVGALEYAEAALKAKVLLYRRTDFQLLESLLWERGRGYWLGYRHLFRLQQTAVYFGIVIDLVEIERRLEQFALGFVGERYKVRLLVDQEGGIELSREVIESGSSKVWRVGIAATPIKKAELFLYHKTTNRAVYEEVRAANPELDEILLWNEEGELTEGTISNVALFLDGVWQTPPIESGLLAGCYRAELIELAIIEEKRLGLEDLERAERIALFNSVRGWIEIDHLVKKGKS